MKRFVILAISLGLNLALMAVVVSQRARLAGLEPRSAIPARPSHQLVPHKMTRGAAPALAAVPPFNWRSVESEDYKVYVQQLRAIGCPEATLRDIITADVRKLYESKRAELPPRQTPKYWEAGFAQGGQPGRQHEASLRALEQEEKQVLKELLGPDWEQAYRPYPANATEEEFQFGDLSAEKREKIRASRKKFDDLESELLNRSLSGVLSAEDEQQLAELRQRQRKELAAILTPEELEQHDLRNSETAQNLRAGLVGLELSEQEFLNVFRWQKKLDELTAASADPLDPKLAQTEKQVEAQIKNLLGEKRFAEFQRGNDPDYRDLQQLAKGYTLPADTVLKVYDLQRQLQQAQDAVELNSDGTSPERNPEWTALQRQASGAIKSLIGDKAYEVYQRRFGDGLTK